ncbi:hypothetical protein E3P86_01766 [Wallemia ichthyophaga]|uniref:RRM domain-containing protein n=1 Tax=Wallemia ichthyophaga TaxID=245174 RepID=A0A4T0JD46_WALIC|nr:hypothetical protein E3P86_01766 [Wallemia ichthyophaga]
MSTTINDVKRIIARSTNINQISADNHFITSFRSSKFPNYPNTATIKFLNPKPAENLRNSLKTINTLTLSTSQIKCLPLDKPSQEDVSLTHFEPATHPGQIVVLSGLPAKINSFDIQSYLKPYYLDNSPNSSDPITNIRIPSDKFSSTSKWLVRLNSVSEAHRLVRNLNQSSWVDSHYTINARIIY